MAKNLIFVRISRYLTLASLLLAVSNAPGLCQGQWWFTSQEATPPSPSTSTATSPTPGVSTSFQATPPSPLNFSVIGYPPTASPPTSPGFTNTPAAAPPVSTGSVGTATTPSSTYSPWTAPPPPPSSYPGTFGAPPPSTGSFPTSPTTPSASPSSATITSSTTLIVSSFSFGPETIYTSVQDAVDAVPENNTNLYIIEILSGTYTEKVSIPPTKPFITLQGAGRDATIITYNDTANSTGSTATSSTFIVSASNFTARNITFQNSAPYAQPGEIGAQAVAMRITGDMAAFYGCGFVSSQDTLSDAAGRHYFRDCYIEGNIDIIWGNGQSLYEFCRIESTATNISASGSITAQGRAAEDGTSGFIFVGGSITGSGDNLLGRAYGLYSRVLFIDTYMEDIINPVGWSDWPPKSTNASTSRHEYYGEYGNTGPGAYLTSRVSWMINLTEAQAANFSSTSFIDGPSWLTSTT